MGAFEGAPRENRTCTAPGADRRTSTTPTHTQHKHTHAAMLAVHPLSLMDALFLDTKMKMAEEKAVPRHHALRDLKKVP